jgi:hypothetical protein
MCARSTKREAEPGRRRSRRLVLQSRQQPLRSAAADYADLNLRNLFSPSGVMGERDSAGYDSLPLEPRAVVDPVRLHRGDQTHSGVPIEISNHMVDRGIGSSASIR